MYCVWINICILPAKQLLAIIACPHIFTEKLDCAYSLVEPGNEASVAALCNAFLCPFKEPDKRCQCNLYLYGGELGWWDGMGGWGWGEDVSWRKWLHFRDVATAASLLCCVVQLAWRVLSVMECHLHNYSRNMHVTAHALFKLAVVGYEHAYAYCLNYSSPPCLKINVRTLLIQLWRIMYIN